MRNKILVATMLIMLIAGVMLSGCATPEDEYNKTKDYIEAVVAEYMAWHGGVEPPHGVAINASGGSCIIIMEPYPQAGDLNAGYVLDFCYLLGYAGDEDSEFFPFELPICCYGQSGEEGTNFYTGNCTNPYTGHYIWLIGQSGSGVCSVCVGDDCWANNESGYQGVWP